MVYIYEGGIVDKAYFYLYTVVHLHVEKILDFFAM